MQHNTINQESNSKRVNYEIVYVTKYETYKRISQQNWKLKLCSKLFPLFSATADNYKFSAHMPYFKEYSPETERNENCDVYCITFLSQISGIA
jgi:hypothetical protein